MPDAPRSPSEQRFCGDLARQIRLMLNHLETAILHAQDRGETDTLAELRERRAHGIRYERLFTVRSGGPDVDYQPRPIGEAEK